MSTALLNAAKAILIALLAIPAAAHAQSVEATGADGSRIVLEPQQAHCTGSAKLARWQGPAGVPSVLGCWRTFTTSGGQLGVQIAWLDGDATQVPAAAFKPVEVL